jgi:hypothetical protein
LSYQEFHNKEEFEDTQGVINNTYVKYNMSWYSITVNQVMVATVKRSKWWLQLNQEEPFVQQLPC